MNSTIDMLSRGYGKRKGLGLVLGALFLSLGLVATSCADQNGTVVATGSGTYAYATDTNYTTSVAASNAALADDWGAVPYSISYGDAGIIGHVDAGSVVDTDAGPRAVRDGGASGSGVAADVTDPASALGALARGDTNICPGSVTVDRKRTPTPCGANMQTGATLTFTGCKLKNGGQLDGTVDVSSKHTASDTACDAGTTITVAYESTSSSLTYVAPSGRKTVIKDYTDSGTYDHSIGTPPSSITAKSEGRIQRFDTSGNLKSDRSFSGTTDFMLSGSPITSIATGTFTVQNAAADGGTATVKVDGLERVPTCCHATGGSVTTTGAATETYTFGPECGHATKNGTGITLDECP